MWRRLAVWVAPSVFGILVIGSGSAVADVHRQQAAQQAAQARQARQLDQAASAQRLEMLALLKTANDLAVTQQQRDQVQAKADDLQGQVDKLKDQIAALQAASVGLGSGPAAVGNPVTAGPGTNHFAYGYCTYYVASKRYIPWLGNAGTWLWSAQAYGWPTGHTPRVGAIEVAALSVWGHVAWVESVNTDGTYWVTEANYYAWNYVDRRLVIPSLEHLIGYIY